jgi:dTDP-4-dehydrorhamnose reductase
VRAILLGAGGMLGRALMGSAPKGVDLVAFRRSELDIADARALDRTLQESRPDVVINAAAYTAVDKAEAEREAAFRINGGAVGNLGRLAARIGSTVVHFSTDYVFDGRVSRPYREQDEPNPLNVYGASKLAGERALQASGAASLILRTSWLFGLHGRSFPRTMLERARSDLHTRVVRDQVGRPTSTTDLARATWHLLARQALGLTHVANSGFATWYDVARQIFRTVGRLHLLASCTSEEYSTGARRPPYSVLDTTRADVLLGSQLPPWETALASFLQHCLGAPQ